MTCAATPASRSPASPAASRCDSRILRSVAPKRTWRDTASRPKPAKSKQVPRSPAMKSQLKAKAKVSSGRGARKLAKPQERLQAVLDAIRATPGDDELRLVYADALEESGELERAELIRAHVTKTERAAALQVERDKVLAAQLVRWRSDRGLVWHVEARIEDWLAHGAQLFDTEPITSIVVHNPRSEVVDEDFDHVDLVAQLAKQSWLAYVHALEVPPYSTLGEPDVLVELLGSPHLRRMTRLQVGHPLAGIAAAKHCPMPALRELFIHCDGSTEGDDALRAFANRRDALARLELVGCGMSVDGIRTMVEAGWRLEHLITAGTHYQLDDIGAAGLTTIARAPALASLGELRIESGGLDDGALEALANSPHLRSLHTLGLGGNQVITDACIAALAESPVLASVQELDLTATAVTEQGVRALPKHLRIIAPHLR